MKRKSLLAIFTSMMLILSGCNSSSSTTTGDNSTSSGSTSTGGSITTPTTSGPTKVVSIEKALSYDYSKCHLGIDTLFNNGESETYYEEFYDGNRILIYTPEIAASNGYEYAFDEFYIKEGQSYTWFDSTYTNGKSGWLQKGYKNADLSIWNANFYLPYALNTLQPEDFTLSPLGGYFIQDAQKRQDFIDEVFGWVIFDTMGAAYPVDISIILDQETSAIKKIFAFFNEGDVNSDDGVVVEFADIGNVNASSIIDVHEAPNDDNTIGYWEYKGWPHDYQEAYYKSLSLEVASPSSEQVIVNENQVTMNIDKKFGVNLITNPTQFEEWDLVTEKYKTITYEYDESILEMVSSYNYSKEFHSLKEGTTTIKATAYGENDVILSSNEIEVTVNPAPTQNLENAIYKFSFIGFTDEENPNTLFANNDYGNSLPYEITASDQGGIRVLEGKNSDIFDDNLNVLTFQPGHSLTSEGRPSTSSTLSFDFSDQQVSNISFMYAPFYAGQLSQFLGNLKSFIISTSNDGENWTPVDFKETIENEASDNFVKLFNFDFEPASKVKINVNGLICGKNGSLGISNLAFSKNELCHDHEEIQTVNVTSISLSKNNLDLYIGETSTLLANVLPTNATNKNVIWTSSDETVVSVDNGNITAIKEGTSTITATTVDGGYSDSCVINVLPLPTLPSEYAGTYNCEERIATIVLNDVDSTCHYISDSYEVTLTLKSIDNRNLVFVNGDDKLSVNMSSEGLYLGTSGASKLNGASLQGSWTFIKEILATDFTLKVNSITANENGEYPLVNGGTASVYATNFKPTDANEKEVSYEVISLGGNGVYNEETYTFTATQAGKVQINATLIKSNVTKSVVFDIHERVLISSITVTSSTGNNEIQSGKTLQLVATINPSNADDQTLTWESSNTSIATVSTSGLVTAKTVSENKTVTIKAISKYDPSIFGSIELTIQPKSSSVLPSNMVGTYSISSSEEDLDWLTGTLTLNADGKGEINSDFGGGFSFEYVSTSGNDYYFEDTNGYQLIVNFDGTSITSVTYYDGDCIFNIGDTIVFDVIS